MSDFQRIKEALPLEEYAEARLERRGRSNYVCPVCHSGEGKNKTAAFSIKGDRFTCFSCGAKGDLFDLIGIVENIPDKREQLARAAELANTELQPAHLQAKREPKPQPVKDISAGVAKHREFIAACQSHIRNQPPAEFEAFLRERGYSLKEAAELGFGYDPETARLVIPWNGSDYYHIDRSTNGAQPKYTKPKREEAGAQPLWNPSFTAQECVFVVEGALDAIPLEMAGYNAVALGGIGVDAFASRVAESRYNGVVVEMLDADERGREAARRLEEALQDTQAAYLPAEAYGIDPDKNLYGLEFKDPGDWFALRRLQLFEMFETAQAIALDTLNTKRRERYRAALSKLNVKDPAEVAHGLLDAANLKEPTPTGIESLDYALGGGLRPGELTFVGAISSYGKTTLTTQIADHIAASGAPVLFVTIEQSAQEIVAKSISRLIRTMNIPGYNCISPGEITDRRRRESWKEMQETALHLAYYEYRDKVAPNLHILEGTQQPAVSDIAAVAEAMREHGGRAPFVFVDYLQLLAPVDQYTSDKRTVDQNVTALRALARDTGAHVVCISSLNRSSYSGAITLDSFKESGAIEYGADNLIGLQPRGIADKLDNVSDQRTKREADKINNASKTQRERPCELVILKHRSGALPREPLPLVFKAECALFVCEEESERGNAIYL